MTDKSYVTMEQHACVVCTRPYDTGAILLDRRLKDTFEKSTVTGWGMCPECQQFSADGFVQLVECKNGGQGSNMKPDDADRTGRICRLKRDAFERVFKIKPPEQGVAFIQLGDIEALQEMVRGEPETKEQVS